MSDDKETKNLLQSNSAWFVYVVSDIESQAIEKKEFWSPSLSVQYREKVNLAWAFYLASLSPDHHVDLSGKVGHCFDLFYKKNELNLEKLPNSPFTDSVKRLFFGSMIFQVISDSINRNENKKDGIPGFFPMVLKL